MPRLSAADLCARVPLTAVTKVLGAGWQQVDDPAGRCRYQSAAVTATLTVAATALTADQWRAQATKAGGKVVDRDRVLAADYQGDGFGPLDELWWSDGAPALVLRVESGVSLDQALAIVAAARAGAPTSSALVAPGGTGSTVAPVPSSSAPPAEPPSTASTPPLDTSSVPG